MLCATGEPVHWKAKSARCPSKHASTAPASASIPLCSLKLTVFVAHSNIYKFIRNGGGLCELGFFINGGDATINPHFDICSKEITTVGSWVYTLRDYATTFDFLKRAKGIGLPIEKLITHKFPLEEINEALKTNLKMEGLKIAIVNK